MKSDNLCYNGRKQKETTMFHAIKLVVLLAALPEARDELLRVWEGIKPEEYEKAPKGPSAREVRKARLEAYLAGDKGAYFS